MIKSIGNGGDILYKCRLCGKVKAEAHSPDWHASVVYATIGIDMNPKVTQHSQAIDLFGICHCDDGRCGVTDLVGVDPDVKSCSQEIREAIEIAHRGVQLTPDSGV